MSSAFSKIRKGTALQLYRAHERSYPLRHGAVTAIDSFDLLAFKVDAVSAHDHGDEASGPPLRQRPALHCQVHQRGHGGVTCPSVNDHVPAAPIAADDRLQEYLVDAPPSKLVGQVLPFPTLVKMGVPMCTRRALMAGTCPASAM